MKTLVMIGALTLGWPAFAATAEKAPASEREDREDRPAAMQNERREERRESMRPRREDDADIADRGDRDRERSRLSRPDSREDEDFAPRPPRFGQEGRAPRFGPDRGGPRWRGDGRGPMLRRPGRGPELGGLPGGADPLELGLCPYCKRPLPPLPPRGQLGPRGREYAYGFGPRHFRGDFSGPLPPRGFAPPPQTRRGAEGPVGQGRPRWQDDQSRPTPFGSPRFQADRPLPPGAPGDLPPRARAPGGPGRAFDRSDREGAGPQGGGGSSDRQDFASEE